MFNLKKITYLVTFLIFLSNPRETKSINFQIKDYNQLFTKQSLKTIIKVSLCIYVIKKIISLEPEEELHDGGYPYQNGLIIPFYNVFLASTLGKIVFSTTFLYFIHNLIRYGYFIKFEEQEPINTKAYLLYWSIQSTIQSLILKFTNKIIDAII